MCDGVCPQVPHSPQVHPGRGVNCAGHDRGFTKRAAAESREPSCDALVHHESPAVPSTKQTPPSPPLLRPKGIRQRRLRRAGCSPPAPAPAPATPLGPLAGAYEAQYRALPMPLGIAHGHVPGFVALACRATGPEPKASTPARPARPGRCPWPLGPMPGLRPGPCTRAMAPPPGEARSPYPPALRLGVKSQGLQPARRFIEDPINRRVDAYVYVCGTEFSAVRYFY